MTEQAISYDWYLIDVHGGMMLTAQKEIIARGVEFFHPKSWRRAMVEGHYRPVPTSMLPGGYAFVALPSEPEDPDQEMINGQAGALKRLRGVHDVFKNSRGRYEKVRRNEIQALKDMEAEEHLEAGKTRPKFVEPKFQKGTMVRVLRHATVEGNVGEFLFSVRGLATLAMPNGIKFSVPDCDLAAITKGEAMRLAS